MKGSQNKTILQEEDLAYKWYIETIHILHITMSGLFHKFHEIRRRLPYHNIYAGTHRSCPQQFKNV